jgi:serine protease AprX
VRGDPLEAGDDPYVITVGASDDRGTPFPADDVVAPFSSHGPTHDDAPKPDVVAPGISIVSHRAPDSTADAMRPAARVDANYFKGTGTSQSAAIVSGLAALMVQARADISPDEVKAALMGTTSALGAAGGAGAGLVDAAAAIEAARTRTFAGRPANRGNAPSTGRGSIDASRGSYKPYTDWKEPGKPEQLSGEVDFLGGAWNPGAWEGGTWTSNPAARVTTVASGWSAAPPPAVMWSGFGWDEGTWRFKSWRDSGLVPETWRFKSWRAAIWN